MVGTAVGKYLANFGVDRDVPRPPFFFSNDDQWRAIIKTLAFNVRHTRDAISKVMELLVAPKTSAITILNRKNNRSIQIGDTLQIVTGSNIGNYTVSGVLPNELIFPSGTFATIPEVGPLTYKVGEGSPPTTGPTEGIKGRLYVATDGTHRFRDDYQDFVNIQRNDILTKLNVNFPEYAETLVLDKNAPNEESITLAYLENVQSGLGKLSNGALEYSHRKYIAYKGSYLTQDASSGDLTLTIQSGTNFPTNSASVQLVLIGDTLEILEGVNAGTYTITGVTKNSVTVGSALTVTGAGANNRFKITPVAVPVGSKGTIFDRGYTANTSGGSSTFVCSTFDFTQTVDPDRFAVVINRGEYTEELIEVSSRVGNVLNLIQDPNDGSKSMLRYPHDIYETVELFGLSDSTVGTYFEPDGTATAGTFTQLEDSSASFAAHLIGSDIEFTSAGFAVPRRRTISGLTSATQLDFTDATPIAVAAGDEYRIIKRYFSGVDQNLYLADASGFPESNFTIVLDRGKENEEVLYIATNTAPTTDGDPWVLALSNPTEVANDHEQDMTVELAQLYVEGCDWEIIETRATGEYTLYVPKGCLPTLTPQTATYLHAAIPDTAAGTTAATTSAIASGEPFFSLDLMAGANSFASAIEQTTEPPGVVMRSVVLDKGNAGEEFAFVSRQRITAIVDVDYFAPAVPTQTYLEVDDASPFIDLVTPYDVVISRRSTNPLSTTENLILDSVDITTTPHRLIFTTTVSNNHMKGDMIELDPVILNVAAPLNSHLSGIDVELLYIVEDGGVPKYKHPDPDITSNYTDLVQATWRQSPPNESYYADSTGQDSSDGEPGKPIFPGSFLFNLVDDNGLPQNFVSSNITKLASMSDPDNPDAFYKIPYQQTIQGADLNVSGSLFTIADGSLYPDSAQNPWYVILDRGTSNEEKLEITGRIPNPLPDYPDATQLTIDPTTPPQFEHPIGSTVDLEVSKLLIMNPTGMSDDGGFYFDYGYRGNEIHLEDLILEGVQDSITSNLNIFDISAKFGQYSNTQALIEATVVIRPSGPNTETKLIALVISDNYLLLNSPLTVPIAPGDAYKIYATGVKVDDSEPGVQAQHIGGVITTINSGKQKHFKREGGVVEEYVRYSERDGAVVTLATPTVFNYAHPSESTIVVGSNTYNTKGDASDFPAYLTGNFLEIIFNEKITNFASIIKAAGIEAKVEEKDA